jgi:hypothetical protein
MDMVSTIDRPAVTFGNGIWEFWFQSAPPACSGFVVSVDTATGTGASNSTITVANVDTGEKVAAYANPNIPPHMLAREAALAGHYFKSMSGRAAMIIWETNGPGQTTGRTLVDIYSYPNLYHQGSARSENQQMKDNIGWAATPDSKMALYDNYRMALSNGYFTNLSKAAIQELNEIVYFKGGTVGHVRSGNMTDPSGARQNHADRVTADALAAKVVSYNQVHKAKDVSQAKRMLDNSSIAGRRAAALKAAHKSKFSTDL